MKLEDLGYTAQTEQFRKENNLDSFSVGRIISEHKERYIVKTTEKEMEGEILGNLRYSASSRADFPAVGDWVAISEYDENKALIHAVLPRHSLIERQAVGKQSEKQIIATNVDYAFIVQAADRDFSINRIERYLTICNTSGVTPIVLLNKIDLIDGHTLSHILNSIRERLPDIAVIAMSNETKEGINSLKERIKKGKTYCLMGSSGVGKSSLLNNLSGKDLMKTSSIGSGTNRGRHVTTHRELHLLDNGGIIIDNPGMREVGVANAESGLEMTFESIVEIARNCRFNDCTHTSEKGCAVLDALERGEIDESSLENYLKMEREKEHFESTVAERRKKDKSFGKMVKNIKKERKFKKY